MTTNNITSSDGDMFEQFLVEGNDHFSQSEYFDAIISYNKSLCYNTYDSSRLYSAYVARSAVYWELKEFQTCLDNIYLAWQHNKAPVIELHELVNREVECKRKLLEVSNRVSDPWNFFKLSHPLNKKIPFIVDCLRVHETWKFGRCVITTKALCAGDIIAIEEPLFRMINRESRYMRCANCMKTNKMNLIPCPGKCVSTMFCSKTCLDAASRNFHRFECSTLDKSFENDNEYDMTILKIVFESLSFCGGIRELEAHLTNLKPNVSIFDFDLNSDRNINLLKAVYSLKKGPSSVEDLSMAEWIVDSHPYLISACKTSAQRNFMKCFIIKIMGIIDRNSYIFYCPSMKAPYVDMQVGTGVFPWASLINHSCSPNVYRTFVDNKQAFVVKKPIEAGQQLFVGYHANFTVAPRHLRQEHLLKDFQFKCGCEACTHDYPLMANLIKCEKNFSSPPKTLPPKTLLEAEKIFKLNCEYIAEHIKLLPFPCFEICSVMQNSFRQLQFIAGKTFVLSDLVEN